jgi:hypothetical protein
MSVANVVTQKNRLPNPLRLQQATSSEPAAIRSIGKGETASGSTSASYYAALPPLLAQRKKGQ